MARTTNKLDTVAERLRYNSLPDSYQEWLYVDSTSMFSSLIDKANWDALIDLLGGEGLDVTIWRGVLMVRPGTDAERVASEAIAALEDYPILDDERHSRYEYEHCIEQCEDAVRRFADAQEIADGAAQAVLDWCERTGGTESPYYAGPEDWYPSKRATFFGYLHFRRSQQDRPA